ncbi:MAG: efflux RND transporter permease subunit, partial [Planctomycetaceae bacterium]|nr:efflux RND transporter permease subunit [Planctomycetaceae bacterium]
IDAQQPIISTSNISDRAIARFVLTAKPPSLEKIAEFQQTHPDLAEKLEPTRRAMNPGLMVFRLQTLYGEMGEEHPELKELMPPDIDLQKLRKFVEDVIETRLERVPGVSDAEVYGGRREELQVIVDPELLAARQITVTDVRDALRRQNKDTSGGDLWEGKRRWVIRTLGQFRSPEQVGRQLLSTRDGKPVYVDDVADVRVGYKKEESISRRYGVSSNGLSVRRESGANVLDVVQGLRVASDELNEGILKQRGLELYLYYDETNYIYSAIGLVQQNIFIGGALTMIMLLLFLHRGWRTLLVTPPIAATAVAAAYISPWFFAVTLLLIIGAGFWFGRAALVVGLAIPTSIVGTFLLLGLMGRSLNVISLAGLAFAVGMLVDNAVVVLENIYRRSQTGEPPFTAAVRGTQEVWGAVLASTLTTIAVFLPVIFVQEMAGQLFRDIALAISCAVGLSLIVSFTVIPTAAARLFRQNGSSPAPNRSSRKNGNGRSNSVPNSVVDSAEQNSRGWLLDALDWVGASSVGLIVGLNRWVQRGRVRSLALVLLLIGLSVGLSYTFWPKVEYLPAGNRNFVMAFLSPPPGYNMQEMMAMGKLAESRLKPHWDADPGSPEAKKLPGPLISYYFFVASPRRVMIGAQSNDPARARELIPILRGACKEFPGTIAVAKQSSLFESGSTGGRTIDIEITGPDLDELVNLGADVMDMVKQKLPPETQALPRPSLDLSSPEIHIQPKLLQSSELHVAADELGYTVDALIDGAYAGDYFAGGEKIDLTIVGRETFSKRTQDIQLLSIATRDGQLVPLMALADVKLSSGPQSINRRERQRAITIQVTPPATMPLEEAMQIIDEEIVASLHAAGRLDGGYFINLAGTADKLRETWNALQWNILLALGITYLLMAALFESWLYPFVIIFSVPLGAVGGILGLRLLNVFIFQPLDMLTMLGFVILIGIVVNNAILIVHQSLNHIRDEGMSPREAIPASVSTRIRPIFITTMTTVFGLLPLVLFPGAGSELYRGVGSVVLGGLLCSTLFTLVLVPTVFTLTMDAKSVLVRRLFGPQEVTVATATALPVAKENDSPLAAPSVPKEEPVETGAGREIPR